MERKRRMRVTTKKGKKSRFRSRRMAHSCLEDESEWDRTVSMKECKERGASLAATFLASTLTITISSRLTQALSAHHGMA